MDEVEMPKSGMICGIRVPVNHLWGLETTLCQVDLGKDGAGRPLGYTGKELILFPNGNASSIHYHVWKTETFYVERGNVELEVYRPWLYTATEAPEELAIKRELKLDYCSLLRPGMIATLYPMIPHRFYVKSGLAIFKEFSTWDDPEDSHRLVPAGPYERWKGT